MRLCWPVAGALFAAAAYQILWALLPPFVDGHGTSATVTIPGFEPPIAGLLEYDESRQIQFLFQLPYLVYALALTASAGAAIWMSRKRSWGSGAVLLVSTLFLLAPWVVHSVLRQALPGLLAKGCFSLGGVVRLTLILGPVILPLAGLAVVLERTERWFSRDRPQARRARFQL